MNHKAVNAHIDVTALYQNRQTYSSLLYQVQHVYQLRQTELARAGYIPQAAKNSTYKIYSMYI